MGLIFKSSEEKWYDSMTESNEARKERNEAEARVARAKARALENEAEEKAKDDFVKASDKELPFR